MIDRNVFTIKFNADEDLSTFLHTVLDKAEQSLLRGDCSLDSLQTQTVVDQTISLLKTLAEPCQPHLTP